MHSSDWQRREERPPVPEGEAITPKLAMDLRCIVFGSCSTPARGEWLRTGLAFRQEGKPLAYGLKGPKNGTRGLLTAVQAYVLKFLIFERGSLVNTLEEALKPSRGAQVDALSKAIADILWKIGEKKKGTICLPQEKCYVQHSPEYFQDSVTEKLHLFSYSDLEEFQFFIKRFLYLLQDDSSPGALLLLYSAVITRGITKIRSDFANDKQYLVTTMEEGTSSIVMLLLTGRATPFMYNGIIYVGDEDHYAKPQYGVLIRSEIGLLCYENDKEMGEKAPGSRLKTPCLPIWVTYCDGHFGILFNTNKELLRNYQAEKRFELLHYVCGGSQCQVVVDTRRVSSKNLQNEDNPTSTNALFLEKIIHTKWEDAYVEWSGTTNVL